MKVLLLHNRYREPGGEDSVVRSEAGLLASRGVEVREGVFDNGSADQSRWHETIDLVMNSAWSRGSYHTVLQLCLDFRPDVVHVHNFWMRLTPSVHAAGHAVGVPTVQTLHNFRLLCANALLYRKGEACEDCVGKVPWRGVARRCYRDSTVASAAVAALMVVNRLRGTWRREVNAFIALSEHSRSRFVAGGLPGERIFVKPNFVPDPGFAPSPSSSKTILYAGRLSPEKGVETLLEAWAAGGLGRYGRLVIAGDGPEGSKLRTRAEQLGIGSTVLFAGRRSAAEVEVLLRGCRAVAVPSLCFENFPRIVVEAYSHGRPVLVSRSGALGEIVREEFGLRVAAGNADEVADGIGRILNDDHLADRLGEAARWEYVRKYTPERNFDQLMSIYRFALQEGVESDWPSCRHGMSSPVSQDEHI